MFELLKSKLAAILQREHWWAEFWSAVVALLWAALSFMQPVGGESMSYRALFASVPPFWMEAVGAAVFLAQISGLVGNWTPLRWCAAGAATWFYSMIFLSFYAAGFGLPTIAPWLGYVGANMFVLFRLPYGLR